MVDPLTLLRDYTVAEKQVTLNGEDLHFEADDLQFPCSTPTAFRSMAGLGEPYTLGGCWFLLRHADKSYPELVDKREMINFLTGVISSSRNMRIHWRIAQR